jgi:hypothetical protein
MNVEKLIEWLSEFPQDYEVVLSEVHILSEDGENLIIHDMPIAGITKNDETKEIRFMLEEPKTEDSIDKHIKSLLDSLSGHYIYADAKVEFSKEIVSSTQMPLYADINLRAMSK